MCDVFSSIQILFMTFSISDFCDPTNLRPSQKIPYKQFFSLSELRTNKLLLFLVLLKIQNSKRDFLFFAYETLLIYHNNCSGNLHEILLARE